MCIPFEKKNKKKQGKRERTEIPEGLQLVGSQAKRKGNGVLHRLQGQLTQFQQHPVVGTARRQGGRPDETAKQRNLDTVVGEVEVACNRMVSDMGVCVCVCKEV